MKLLGLAAGGAAGSLARYALSGWAQRLGSGFPWGTLAVNALGCLLFGFLWSLAEGRAAWTPATRSAVFIGFLGAFTTFSTYAFETAELMRGAQWAAAAANLAAHNLIGIAALMGGWALGRNL